VLVLVCVLVQCYGRVQPDHVSVGLHFVESRMHRNVKAVAKRVMDRMVDLLRVHGSCHSLLTSAEGLSAALPTGGATPMPDAESR